MLSLSKKTLRRLMLLLFFAGIVLSTTDLHDNLYLNLTLAGLAILVYALMQVQRWREEGKNVKLNLMIFISCMLVGFAVIAAMIYGVI